MKQEALSNNPFMKFIEKRIAPIGIKIGSQRHVMAIRASFLQIISFITIGSFFLLFANIEALTPYIGGIMPAMGAVADLTFNFVAVYFSFAFGANLGKEYDLDSHTTGLLATMTFLVSSQSGYTTNGFSTSYFGVGGFFAAILFTIYAVEIYRLCLKKGIHLKSPEGVPPAVGTFFIMLVPQIIIITPVWLLSIVGGFDVTGLLFSIFGVFATGVDSFWSLITMTILADNGLMFFGIHPWTLLGPMYIPVITANTVANAQALAAGLEMPFIQTLPFYQGAKWGGTGGCMGLVILCLFSKLKRYRTLGKLAFIPMICGINEPLHFGLPVAFNPVFFIPYVIVQPIVSYGSFYLFTMLGWVTKGFIPILGFLPAPITLYIGTLDWRAPLLGFVSGVLLPMLVYYPFFKVQEKIDLEIERKELAAASE